MSIRQRLSDLGTFILVGCAIAVTWHLYHPTEAGTARDRHPTEVDDWQGIVGAGHTIGASHGLVTIVEFGDFECPACRAFHQGALAGVRHLYGDQVRIVFRHWPLSYHRHAMALARVAECAGQVGRFPEFHDLVYEQQDSIGAMSPMQFAVAAGIPDTVALGRCVREQATDSIIEADVRVATRTGAPGTPAILIDGLLYGWVPDSMELDSIVRANIMRASSGTQGD